MPCGKGCLLQQHMVSAERNNRHLWRRRFSDSVQATGALYAIASATRPSGTGGAAVQRAAADAGLPRDVRYTLIWEEPPIRA